VVRTRGNRSRAHGRAYAPREFKEGLYYRLVRHPLMLGFIIASWSIPRMSVGYLLFALATTG
jgi:protein-S-isoprenylcysteine O-methyltransferase Ste14